MKRRFYEEDRIVNQAIDMMLVFPDDLQSVIAQGVSRITDKEFLTSRLNKHVQSLGADVVLALYKSKQKQRGYDTNQYFHQMLNDLLVLSPENRHFVCEKVMELMGFITEYLQTCKVYAINPERETVDAITSTYVKLDKMACAQFIRALKKEFMDRLDSKAPVAQVHEKRDKSVREAVKDEGQGMKIRGDMT